MTAPVSLPPLSPLVTPAGTLFRLLADAPLGPHLLLYEDAKATRPSRTLQLDPLRDRTGDVWELFVAGVTAGQHYLWAINPRRPLLDPWALALSGPTAFGADGPARARVPFAERNRNAEFKCIVLEAPPSLRPRKRRPWCETVLYELHTRGFTRHPSSGVTAPGTFAGLAEKAPYLADLGVTAVELMPVQEFDETEVRVGTDLFNLWGYSPLSWFAPQRRYATRAHEADGPIAEFRAMVETFHDAGLEVIVDVVFNHTAELGADGPTWSLRGLHPNLYYLRDPESGADRDFTGCGNTVRVQHPTVRTLIRQALRWWVHALGVDGFRFDLATVLCRDEEGELMAQPPLLREIESDPWLAECRLIAEPWDAGGGHLVANWPGNDGWAVWNDRFRDDVRRAWLVDAHYAGALASRLSGSSDLFAHGPGRGVNAITSHDGFTLRDLLTYDRRHNDANGEGGRDGPPHEICAIVPDPDRTRRNLIASLLLAQGVPMLLGGDELGRTQRGNNNAYCQDSEISWVDWGGLESDSEFHRFVRGLIRLRRATPLLMRERFLEGDNGGSGGATDVRWLGPDGGSVDWEADPGHFAYLLSGDRECSGAAGDAPDLLVLINLLEDPRDYRLPPDRHGATAWSLRVDTAAAPPADYFEATDAPLWTEPTYPLEGNSLALLFAAPASSPPQAP